MTLYKGVELDGDYFIVSADTYPYKTTDVWDTEGNLHENITLEEATQLASRAGMDLVCIRKPTNMRSGLCIVMKFDSLGTKATLMSEHSYPGWFYIWLSDIREGPLGNVATDFVGQTTFRHAWKRARSKNSDLIRTYDPKPDGPEGKDRGGLPVCIIGSWEEVQVQAILSAYRAMKYKRVSFKYKKEEVKKSN